jgi:hypothetical protein
VLKFWPTGDDTYSRATRLKTTILLAYAVLCMVAGAGIVHHIRSYCSC